MQIKHGVSLMCPYPLILYVVPDRKPRFFTKLGIRFQ